jgi:hypothetical protein
MSEWLKNKVLKSELHRGFLEYLFSMGDNQSRWEAVWERTQPGVAESLGCARSRVSLIANESISAGFVEPRFRHIIGELSDGRKRIAYFITPAGRTALKP